MTKVRASPFIPFCHENLSPLCSIQGNFTANNSKRMLFSPMYEVLADDKMPSAIEEGIKMGSSELFMEGNVLSPGKPTTPFFQQYKSPICRLNFDKEVHRIQTSNIPVEISKISDFNQFTSPSIGKGSEGKNCQMKSSPIQMFNSFTSDSAYLQTIEQRSGLAQSERKVLNRKMCCNCKKSHCLKLYCECFTNKLYCQGCNCTNCLNTPDNNEVREKAMQTTLERNPAAFNPRIARVEETVIPITS
eukprot:TRINITY_DN1584_c0_g5_i3.p1 TRINITY_DN1584_c0_g5~~TRINITY_DN1584_c0_g5_i3.p1  ORF type:complete len:246 (+),score=60.54 TRINITY_DN1584_c0_g5_i3:174-911(+)